MMRAMRYFDAINPSFETRSVSATGVMHKQRLAGFTLIEILIVIVILGLLVSLVAPAMFSKVTSSQRQTAMAQMQMIATSLDTYRLDMGQYPERLEELRRSDRPGWDGPYMPRDVPLDPWGNPYVYVVPGEDGNPYSLRSYGAGGRPGGEGDEADIIFQ
jgi:general secretion pathway protein G